MFLFGKKRKEEVKSNTEVEGNTKPAATTGLADNDEAVAQLTARPSYTFDMETKTLTASGVSASKVELTEEQLAQKEVVSKEAYEFDVVAYIKRHKQPFERIRLHNRNEMRALFHEGVKVKKIRLPENISMFYDDTYEFADDEDYTLGGRIKNVVGHEYYWVGTALFFADDGVTPIDMTDDLLDVVRGQLLGVYAELEEDVEDSAVTSDTGDATLSAVTTEDNSISAVTVASDTGDATSNAAATEDNGISAVTVTTDTAAEDEGVVFNAETAVDIIFNDISGDADTKLSDFVEKSFEDSDSTENSNTVGVFDTVSYDAKSSSDVDEDT